MPSDTHIESILSRWIASLRGSTAVERSDDLLDAYRVLGRVVLSEALGGEEGLDGSAERDPGSGATGPEDDRLLQRARSGVAAAVRRQELTISWALEDLRKLVPKARTELEADLGDGPAARAALRVSEVLDRSLRSIVRAMEAAAERAERERAESLAAFTDQLSHELENRLGAARTAGQILGPSGVALENLDLQRVGALIESSIEAALKTVQDVRDLVVQRVNPRGRAVRTMPLPLLVRAVIDDLSPMAFEAGVDVTMADDMVDRMVDSARFRLIVYNLVGNGIKYHDPEKDHRFVKVEAESLPDGRVELSVSDNGLGIPEEDQDDIFLLRSRGGGSEDVPGTGLGLAIAQEAVDQIGGSIDVRSEVGVGATFVVRFRPAE